MPAPTPETAKSMRPLHLRGPESQSQLQAKRKVLPWRTEHGLVEILALALARRPDDRVPVFHAVRSAVSYAACVCRVSACRRQGACEDAVQREVTHRRG